MTAAENQRLIELERVFASEGRELTQAEIAELEALRDLAGQGWLFGEQSEPASLDDRGLCDRDRARELAGARLNGFDGGEQADLFDGPGLLL